jgi:hypothetical protein
MPTSSICSMQSSEPSGQATAGNTASIHTAIHTPSCTLTDTLKLAHSLSHSLSHSFTHSQLVKVVLKRRASDEQAVVGAELAHDARQHAVLVLDAVRLVDDDVAPVEALEVVLLPAGQTPGKGRGGMAGSSLAFIYLKCAQVCDTR